MSKIVGKGCGRHEFLNRYIRSNKVRKILEIGIDDGNNAKNMVEAARENLRPKKIEYYGFDTFEDKSKYEKAREKLEETGCSFELHRGSSEETLPKATENLPKMDLIFIDGGHNYETIKSDWENSKKLMDERTSVYFHNYDFSGVKRIVDEIPRKKFSVDIFDPEGDCPTAHIQMV